MILYVVRHAKAIERNQLLADEARYLTKQGRTTVREIRSKLAKAKCKPNVIITSTLVRAVQTAEILAAKINPKTVIATPLLNPNSSVKKLLTHIKSHKNINALLIVGHEPLLSLLIGKLLDQPSSRIEVKKSACVALKIYSKKNKKSDFLWYLAPNNKLIKSSKKFLLKK